MRKLLFIIILFFSTSAFAELAEVYFCEQIKNVGIVAKKFPPPGIFEVKPEDQFRFEEFLNLKFSFKIVIEGIECQTLKDKKVSSQLHLWFLFCPPFIYFN